MKSNKYFAVFYNTWLFDSIGLGACLFIFYTLWLGSYPLFTPDEGRYSEIAREMLASKDFITPKVNGVVFLDKPILYYWLQACAIFLFGVKEWSLRLFPCLFGIAGCLLVYICGRQIFNRRTGLFAALLLATAPLYFGAAHYSNLDLEVAIWISSSLLFFLTAFEGEERLRLRFLLAAYFTAACAFLTKGLIGIILPGAVAFLWLLSLKRSHWLLRLHLIPGILLFSIIVLPWYILIYRVNPNFLYYFFVTQQISRFLSSAEFNNPVPWWFYLPIIVIGFFPWCGLLLASMKFTLTRVVSAHFKYRAELFLIMRLRFLLAAYFTAACAFLTKGLIGIILPGAVAFLWLLSLKRSHWLLRLHLIPGILLFSIIVLPWYILIYRVNPNFLYYFFVTQQISRFLSSAEFNNPVPWWFYLPILIVSKIGDDFIMSCDYLQQIFSKRAYTVLIEVFCS